MAKVQITNKPPGKTPESVRVQFVGVSMPYDPNIQGFHTEAMEYDGTGAGYVVRIGDVINALREYGRSDVADFLCHALVGEKYLWLPGGSCKLIET